MTGNQSPDANLRRRQSSTHDSDGNDDEDSSTAIDHGSSAISTGAQSPTRPEHTFGSPGRAATNPSSGHNGGTDGNTTADVSGQSDSVNDSSTAGAPRTSTTNQPRVRFSTDVQRPSQSNAGTSLNIDTQLATSSSGRPGFLRSQGSKNSGSAPIPGSPSSPEKDSSSPISPSSRSRGYSLRRTLFNRNIRQDSDEGTNTSPSGQHGAVVGQSESTDASSSITSATDTKKSSHRRKKSGGSVVSVSPVLPSFDGSTESKTTSSISEDPVAAAKALYGIGADGKVDIFSRRSKGISLVPLMAQHLRQQVAQFGPLKEMRHKFHQLQKVVLRYNEIPPSKDGRHIPLDLGNGEKLTDERTGGSYLGNSIRSSRYTAWNFLPRQLVAQFSKLANFYFLCVSILQMIPGLSTTGTYTTIVPLLIFVSISIAKEGYDDLRRYRLDKAENNREGRVMKLREASPPKDESSASESGGLLDSSLHKWQDLKVGQLIKLERDEAAPADMVLLHSTGAHGVAYVETMALDGETNLKSKTASPSLAKIVKNEDDLADFKAELVVEDPNLDLYNFEGKLILDEKALPLTPGEVVLRGSILRNTPSAIGIIIYTGEECKIRMNANKNPRIKAPHLQAIVNKVVVFVVIFVILLAVGNTVAYQIWSHAYEPDAWYLKKAGVEFFPIFAGFVIMFNTMIPLSLYVSLEIVKLFQMLLLNDIDMYDEISDTPFEARTSTINEELGQINYIFSDKTGTLTDNIMKFRKMSVAGTAWLHDLDLNRDGENQQKHKRRKKGKEPSKKKSRISKSLDLVRKSFGDVESRKSRAERENQKIHDEVSPSGEAEPDQTVADENDVQWRSSARPSRNQFELRTRHMLAYLQHKPYTVFARKAKLFLLSIALCHTCLPEIDDNGEINDFQASSPDELALVRAAMELGYLVVNRDLGILSIKTFPHGKDRDPVIDQYEVLDVIEFSSKRKRMSVVVRFPDNRLAVICKGADSVVTERLKQAHLANEKVIEIEKRSIKRKSMEAQQAIRRKSEQIERKASMGRPSFTSNRRPSLGRPSFTSRRSSATPGKLHPISDQLDAWLKERENDVEVSSIDEDTMYYTPRPSTQFPGRASFAISEARSSMNMDEFLDDLVDEAMVVDEHAVIERTFTHINDFATEGLRTLLYGYRFLDESEYYEWKQVYSDATTSLVDRQARIEAAGEMIETQLDLAGATAIEDKLQMGVPQAIDKLRRANIKMWMLTGDKRETAINIGHSCRLIKDYSTITVLDHEAGDVDINMATALLAIAAGGIAHAVIVVDGQTLATIESDKVLNSLFVELALVSDAVICCRASPSQKAGLVRAIRKKAGKESVTLAIGDGANDIAMIQEAHVGIGITGKEGLQAARTSDYSIAQFRFLTKLLLVHGRWNYIRTCKYTVGTFWKEMLFYLTQALYQRWNGYTGTSLYESWSLSMFNTLFTSLPVIFMGIFEKDLSASTLLAVPELYTKGQRNGGFNFIIYFAWMFMAASESMIVYFSMLGLYGGIAFTNDQSLYAMGDMTFTACVIVISAKMQFFEMHNKSLTAVVAIFLSVGGWFLWNIILAARYTDNVIYYVKDAFFDRFGRNITWWLTLIIIVLAISVFELGITSLRAAYFTTDVDTFQALEHDPLTRRRFEEASATELQNGWTMPRQSFKKWVWQCLLDAFPSFGKKASKRIPYISGVSKRSRQSGNHEKAIELEKREHKDSGEVAPPDEVGESEREREIREMLEQRAAEGNNNGFGRRRSSGGVGGGTKTPRRSTEIAEMFRRGFGAVREE